MHWKFRLFLLVSLALSACGGAGALPSRSSATRLSLASTPEALELAPATMRQQLFTEIAIAADREAGNDATEHTIFSTFRDGKVVAAPGFGLGADLLQPPDAGNALQLVLDGPTSERGWYVDPRRSLLGLNEREAAGLIAGSLLNHWGISSSEPIQVVRVTGAPYAAAYVHPVFMLNVAFVYVAAAAAGATQ